MFCTKCGKELKKNDFAFCPFCGQKVYVEENEINTIDSRIDEITEKSECDSECSKTEEISVNSSEQLKEENTKASDDGEIKENYEKSIDSVDNTNSETNIDSTNNKDVEDKNKKAKRKFNGRLFLSCFGCVAVIFILVFGVGKLLSRVKETDITHGGEEKTYAGDGYTWRFDFNWAEYDEEWKGISSSSEIDVLADIFLESDDLSESLNDQIAKNYIEARLNPEHYSIDSYWGYSSSNMREHADKMWKKYLKAHKELLGMYIFINGDKYYPYKDDDFDKNVFMNPNTAIDADYYTSDYSEERTEYKEVDELEDYNPFDYLTVEFSGISGRAEATITYEGKYLSEDDFAIEPNQNLSLDDEISVYIIDSTVAEERGANLINTEQTYTVEGIAECITVDNMSTDEKEYLENEAFKLVKEDVDRLIKYNSKFQIETNPVGSVALSMPVDDEEPLNEYLYIYQADLQSQSVLPHRYFYIVKATEYTRSMVDNESVLNIGDITRRGQEFLPSASGEIRAVEDAEEVWKEYIEVEINKYNDFSYDFDSFPFDGVPIGSVNNINNDGKNLIENYALEYAQTFVERLREKHSNWTVSDCITFQPRLYKADDGTATVVMIMKYIADNNSTSESARWVSEVYMPIVFENVEFNDSSEIIYSKCSGELLVLGVSTSFPRSDGNSHGYISLENLELALEKGFPTENYTLVLN